MSKYSKLASAGAVAAIAASSVVCTTGTASAFDVITSRPSNIPGYAALCGSQAYKAYEVSPVVEGTRRIVLRSGNHFCAFAVNMTGSSSEMYIAIWSNSTSTMYGKQWRYTKMYAGPILVTLPLGSSYTVRSGSSLGMGLGIIQL